ncbi:hypothetical protein FRC11_002362, partial [Ceratobasidium sp. 423]
WQGGTLPVQFENGDEDVDEDKRVVNSMRLPDSVRYFLHPSKWEGDDYALWEDHLWCGQKLYLPRHRRFQYSWLCGANGEIFFDDIREDMAPESQLCYDSSARIFTAQLLRNAKNDDLAHEECMFNMPFAPEHLDTDSFWDEETIQEVAAHCHDESIMLKLVEELTWFEATGPIQATRGKWKQYQELHPEFTHDCPKNDLSIDAIGGWWLPLIYFPAKRRRKAQLALADLSEFVRGWAMRHEMTNMMLASRYGVRWGIFLIIRTWNSICALEDHSQCPKYFDVDAFNISSARHHLLEDAEYLRDKLYRDIQYIVSIRETNNELAEQEPGDEPAFSYSFWELDEPNVEQATLHQAPSPVQSEDEQEYELLHGPKSILRPSRKSRSKKGNVEILLPPPGKPGKAPATETIGDPSPSSGMTRTFFLLPP